MEKIANFDDVRQLIADMPGPSFDAVKQAAERESVLTKPPGALGRLETLSAWVAAWQGRHPLIMDRVVNIVFAGNHGVAARGVSAFPSEVTHQMVANFRAGGAAINQICAAGNIELRVGVLALDSPTQDFTQAPAMEEDDCVEAIRYGMESVEDDCSLLCLGEMGIGNTASAAAICYALWGGDPNLWVGPGTGVQGQALKDKLDTVAKGVVRHRESMTDGLEILRCVGGRELAAIAGAILAARLKRIPVVLDGYVCTAAAATLTDVRKSALDHCQAGHCSAEPGHKRMLEKLNKKALIDLGMRLGEGTGGAVAVSIIRAAVACHNGMATFAEAGVSDKD